jgi:hypothetical protein
MGQPVEADPLELQKDVISETLFDHVSGVVKSQRAPMPELPVAERIQSFDEADQVLSEDAALGESSRCLSCCLTCYNPDKIVADIEAI